MFPATLVGVSSYVGRVFCSDISEFRVRVEPWLLEGTPRGLLPDTLLEQVDGLALRVLALDFQCSFSR